MNNHAIAAARIIVPAGYAWTLVVVLAAAVVAMFVSLQAAVILLLATILAWWSWQNPAASFYLLVVVSPLLPMFKVTQTLGSITLLKDVLLLTGFLRLVVLPLLSKTLPYRRNVLGLPLLGLFLWLMLATLRSDSLILGLLRARELGLYLLAYFFVLYLPRRRQFLAETLHWVLAAYAVIVTASVYQWLYAGSSAVLRFDPARQIWIPRLSATLAHPSVLGHYLTIIAIVCAAAAWSQRGARRWQLAAVSLSTLPLIYFTYSRAVWFGLAAAIVVGLGATWYQQWRGSGHRLPWRQIAWSLVAASVVLTLLVQGTSLGVFLKSSFDTGYRSNEVRLEYVARLLAPTTNTEALLGRGLGDVIAQNFREIDVTAFDIASTASRNIQLAKDSTLVDNQYLKTFIELGFFGLLLYAWIFFRLARTAWALLSESAAASIGLIGLTSLVAAATQALFIDLWDIYPTNVAFWIIAGLISAAAMPPLKSAAPSAPNINRPEHDISP